MNRMLAGLLAMACAVAPAAHAQAPQATTRIRGAIVALDGPALQVKTDSGASRTVRLAPGYRVSARSPSELGAVGVGKFVGATAMPQPDGTLVATEVHIFPESMRGVGEGHRPLAYDARGTMTNATVTSVAPAGGTEVPAPRGTMTNATVASVTQGQSGRRLTLRYKDGEQVIVVAASCPVVMVEEGTPALLVPGAHVVITAARAADGTLTADRVIVGKDGLVPPG